MQRLIIASNNSGKLREIEQFLAPRRLQILPHISLDGTELEEPYQTFVENALAKARHASKCTGLPALADDSGICVHSLGGAPGIFSARYAGEPKSDQRNNQKLIETLKFNANRTAYYYCIMVLARSADDPQPIIADVYWYGEIILTSRGEGGFGYDPYFFVPELGKTAAELSSEQKNQYSHRSKALVKLTEMLVDYRF